MEYDSYDICQTQYMTSWIRNPAALLVITIGTLDFFIAPFIKNVELTLWSILTHCIMKYIYKFYKHENDQYAHLTALLGKNFPFLLSSELITKNGALQMYRSSLLNMPFFKYCCSHPSSSTPSWHWIWLSQRNFSIRQIFIPAHLPSLAVHIRSSSSSQYPPTGQL